MCKKIMVLAILLVIAIMGLVCSNEESPYISTPDKETVVKGNNAFALDLYTKLRQEEGNLFFSPWSISSALAMTYAGARGNTEAQMAKVLHFDLEQARLHPAFAQIIKDLVAGKRSDSGVPPQAGKGYQLHIANALWGQQGYNFLKPFLALTRDNYDAGLREVDFITATDKARVTINAWVEEQTKDKIKDLIKPGVLDSLTRLVLTNAIYFKGDWASEFNKEKTKNAAFTLLNGKTIEVPMMYQQQEFLCMETDDFQVLKLPYRGTWTRELSMFVFLPKKVDGLPDLEKSFTLENLTQWLRQRWWQMNISVYLPKFKISSGFRLSKVLSAMGMRDAFILGKANFLGIANDPELFIQRVIHKACLDVNEKGSEAAAFTAAMLGKGGGSPSDQFRADHPFIFLIQHTRSGSILFLGRIMNPTE